MLSDLAIQLKLIRPISRPLLIQIVIAQREIEEKLNVSHTCIKTIKTAWLCEETRFMGPLSV